MPFTIPNEADAGNARQAEIDKVDIDILIAGVDGEGVISGCAVTAQGTPDMTVAVAAGVARVSQKRTSVTAGNVTITAADATNPRFDLVVVDDAGTKTATAGTPAASPVFPAIPTDRVVLAAVYVPANDTAIESGQIVDKRVGLRVLPLHGLLSGYFYSTPGWSGYATGVLGTSIANTNNDLYGFPFVVYHETTFDRITVNCTTADAGGGVIRLGVYHAQLDGTPGDLVFDAGTVSLTTTGQKDITISQTLAPGAYWLAAVCEGIVTTNPAFARPSIFGADSGVNPLLANTNNNTYKAFLRTADITPGSLPTPFGAGSWTGAGTFSYVYVFLRVA